MFTVTQIVLIILMQWIISYEGNNVQLITKCFGQQTLRGFLTGLIMGDPTTGLLIGGTMQLMALGLAGFGGASIPNYGVAAIVGTAFAVATQSEAPLELALAIGIPVATLGLQLDVLAKMLGSFWLHLAEKFVDKGDYKGCYRTIIIGNIFGGRTPLNNVYPLMIYLLLGSAFVETIINYMPAWLTACLTTVSGVLPALGMAILLHYMPVKSNFQWLIFGFIASVYLGQGILPIALMGTIIAVCVYKIREKERLSTRVNVNSGGIGDE